MPAMRLGFDEAELAALTAWHVAPAETSDKPYSADDELFSVRVDGVAAKDREVVVATLKAALVSAGLSYSVESY